MRINGFNMKKTISYFSRVLYAFVLSFGLMFTSCYDDSALLGQIGNLDEQYKDLDSRVKELERLVAQQNTNITSLQTVVAALQENDYVTNVSPITEGSKVTGYTITFNKKGAITIYNGKDGCVPAVGVKQDTDGRWYWTIDGNWMLDANDNKVRASAIDGEDGAPGTPGQNGNDGVTPKLKIEDGYWFVSYDNGQNWERYAPATGEKGEQGDKGDKGDQGDSMFQGVTYDTDYVYLTLSNGTVLTVPRIKIYSGENMVGPATLVLEKVTSVAAMFTGNIDLPENLRPFSQVAVYYSDKENFNIHDAECEYITIFNDNGDFNLILKYLEIGVTYRYCVVVTVKQEQYYGEVQEFTTSDINVSIATDLSSSGSANSYIVSEKGMYKFRVVKGNSNESVGTVTYADILWETYGSDENIKVGDIVSDVLYMDDCIAFKTADTFREGNAVIAAKDASGNILWSWHIWLTDQPEEQRYYNNAGIMMDRNLGATSATPGDVGALGLLYQWGRKDPFLGSSSISDDVEAKSTIIWPSAVSSDPSVGTIEYAIANPTTYIGQNDNNYDWYYSDDFTTDYTRWTTSETSKSIYDPCPSGWRIPDGGRDGVWMKALDSTPDADYTYFDYDYNRTKEGMDFSGTFGSASTIWYPASGLRSSYVRSPDNNLGIVDSIGDIASIGAAGYYWSVCYDEAHELALTGWSEVRISSTVLYSDAVSVRCVKDSK